jgi:hypothetical protein
MDKTKLFVSLDINNVVENWTTISYSHRLVDCEGLNSKNNPEIGATFDEELNVFISPKESWMDDTWTFNIETFRWEPDPDLTYYHIDNIPHKWNPETNLWYAIN